MAHYCYHAYNHRHSVLKKNFNKEYQQLVDMYGEENIELEKELTFAYWYKCWVNEAIGKWIFDSLINEYVFILDDDERKDYNE